MNLVRVSIKSTLIISYFEPEHAITSHRSMHTNQVMWKTHDRTPCNWLLSGVPC
jgi:hypothetical protein